MNWLKQLLSHREIIRGLQEQAAAAERSEMIAHVRTGGGTAAWPEQQRALFMRMGMLPENDALMTGLIAWQDARLADVVRDCDNPNLTAEQALVLVHRMAEVTNFREALVNSWRQAREKQATPKG